MANGWAPRDGVGEGEIAAVAGWWELLLANQSIDQSNEQMQGRKETNDLGRLGLPWLA